MKARKTFNNLVTLAETERQAHYLTAFLGADKGIPATIEALPKGKGHKVVVNGDEIHFIIGKR